MHKDSWHWPSALNWRESELTACHCALHGPCIISHLPHADPLSSVRIAYISQTRKPKPREQENVPSHTGRQWWRKTKGAGFSKKEDELLGFRVRLGASRQ